MQRCSLNLETPDFAGTKGEYYTEVNFYEFETGTKLDFDIVQGNFNLKSSCGLPGLTQPVCSQKSFYVIDKEQKKYRVDIMSIVNKVDKNA